MKIIITGAGGYIGRHVAMQLASEGHEVTALLTTPSLTLQEIKNIHQHVAPDYHAMEWNGAEVFKDQDILIHAASRVHKPEDGAGTASLYRKDNLELSINLAAQAQHAGVKRFLFISSIGAQVLENRFHEGRMTNAKAWLRHPYRMSKLEAERALLRLSRAMSVSAVRLPMVYGANAPGSFSSLLRFMRGGVPLPLKNYTQRRAFVSVNTVQDFISYYVRHAQADGKIWAIRDGDEVSPPVFAAAAARAAHLPVPRFWDCPPWLFRLSARLVGRHQTAQTLAEPLHVDLGPVTRKLGWQPALTVEEGLKKAFAAY